MPSDANAMSNKRNVVLYLDEDLVDKSKAPSFNLSRTFENHLKKLISQLSNQQNIQNHLTAKNLEVVVGLPGFEPESIEPKSTSLDQASRQPQSVSGNIISVGSIKTLSTFIRGNIA